MLNRIFLSVIPAVMTLSCSAQAQEELKLGVLATFSGAGAAWGNAMKGAVELAVADVNAAGGLDVGGRKYQVRIVAYDDQYKASEALTAVNRLLSEDKIKLLVGPMGSAPAVAVLPLTSAAKVITLTPAFSDRAINKDTPYTFRPVLPSSMFSAAQAAWVVRKLGVRKIAAFYPNDETGQALIKDNEKAYEAAGARVVVKEMFDRERTDFTPLIIRALGTDADALDLNGNSPQTAGLILKQAREYGWSKPIIRTGGDATAEILAVAGEKYAEGLYVHQPLNAEIPEMAKFIERWKTTYKSDVNAFAPPFYATIRILFDAIQRAGTVDDTDKICDSMLAIKDFPSPLGPVNWTGEKMYGINHQLDAPFYIGQVRNGTSVIVATCTSKACE
jgi:branched-chain amino acid transport system substrate-binding protein